MHHDHRYHGPGQSSLARVSESGWIVHGIDESKRHAMQPAAV